MKILFFHAGLGYGGASKMMASIANNLSSMHEVILMTYRNDNVKQNLNKSVKFEYNPETGQNEIVQKIDNETGLPLYVSFDDAWQIITKELHEVDSFEELMSELQRLAKTKAFFAQLYKNTSSIGNDIQL